MIEPEASRRNEITQALVDLAPGRAGREAIDSFMRLVYDDLRRIASNHLRNQKPGHSLQPTAIVHEAYLKLVNLDEVQWKNRAQFMSVASRLMRQVLVDHARRRMAVKRQGGLRRVTLETSLLIDKRPAHSDLLVLDDALQRLAMQSERARRVAEMRLFSGMTNREIATVEGLSERTISADWVMARMWLSRELAA